ncbi:hypothetical protein GC176_18120 [bacterium]|nr:hypothetical protein [bacterium]
MNRVLPALLMAGFLSVSVDVCSFAADGFASRERTLWTNSRIAGTPDPPAAYTLQVAFPHLKFDEPLSFGQVPGTGRLAMAERTGKIFAFADDRSTSEKSLLLDVGRTVYGIAFHPDFARNGRLFVTSITGDGEDGSLLSEFTVTDREKLSADPNREVELLRWPTGGHNGGCIRFGPNGLLYLATGDGSGIADQRLTGQDISDLTGSVLRIDVDNRDAGRAYGIPKDNPFVAMKNARPEVYAYGLRQLWKFSFDPQGRLWGGEVGQDLWEMIYIIERGGNYGWSVNEGRHPFRPERPRGPTAIVAPIVEHPHSDFRSITGGYVYTGNRLPKLKGHYIYGDYDTGKIWALKWDAGAKKVVAHFELCDEQLRLVEFGLTGDAELLLVDYAGGQLNELIPAPPASENSPPFPRKLSETGLFASTHDHTPESGVIPYDVIAPLWSDHAHKDRFLAIPGKGQIEFEAVTYPQPAPGSRPGWRFPDGTVLVKTFSLEMEAGNPASRKRLETRLLHYEKMPGKDDVYGAQVWHGYTYLWNDEQTDAVLLDAQGLDREYTIRDASAPDGIRRQTWHFPSRAECTLCHTMAAKYALGVQTNQLNHDYDYGAGVGKKNQIEYFNELGLFTQAIPGEISSLDRLTDYHAETASLNDRARSYLHANCSHCHRKWGGGNAEFQLLQTLPLEETGTVNVKPGQGQFNLQDARLLVPGDPDRSLIWFRMNRLGLGRMPHVASSIRDEQAITLIRDWISSLK